MSEKITEKEAEEAVRTLLKFIGEDPKREGLLGTPRRVVNSYKEFFRGYNEDPYETLSTFFEEVGEYDEMVVLNNIRLESYCEHHLLPIIGVAHVAYIPVNRVVGISKLARIVDIYAKRVQIQEKMTAQIANAINDVLEPDGVGVVIQASHHCMSVRGTKKPGSFMTTSSMLGSFRDDSKTRSEFLDLINKNMATL